MIYTPIGTVARMWADSTYSSFTDSLVELLSFSNLSLCRPGEYIHYDKATVSWHEQGRNELVSNFLGDWLLMLDTDHVFAPDLLVRLLEFSKKYNARVISGAYTYKFYPHAPVANLWLPDNSVAPILDWNRDKEVLEVGPVGGGCLLIHRDVFDKIHEKLNEEPFSIIRGLSEDYSFCKRCQLLGIPVFWAPRVQCHHTIRTVLSLDDYNPPPDKVPLIIP